jgi:multidrug efflux pump subunit AcrB
MSSGQEEDWIMKRFNLSEWAITHQALVLFMILLLGAAGAYSYFNLGRAEDPSFTIKTMIVNVAWPGATAAEMQTQVADKIEKKLQDLPYLDRVQSYSQPGVSFIQVFLRTQLHPPRSRTSGTRCARRLATSEAICLPASSAPISTTSTETSIPSSTC